MAFCGLACHPEYFWVPFLAGLRKKVDHSSQYIFSFARKEALEHHGKVGDYRRG